MCCRYALESGSDVELARYNIVFNRIWFIAPRLLAVDKGMACPQLCRNVRYAGGNRIQAPPISIVEKRELDCAAAFSTLCLVPPKKVKTLGGAHYSLRKAISESL